MTRRLLLVITAVSAFAAGAHAQERQWTLDASDQDAYLIFGVPDSDDVGLSMWCQIGQGTVNVFVPESSTSLPVGTAVDLTLKAGETETVIKAKADINEDAGVSSVEGQIVADAPIFDAMTKADRLNVNVAEEKIVYPLFDADVPGLLELCRKK